MNPSSRHPAADGAGALSPVATRVLAHITARTITGRCACPRFDLPSGAWADAIEELTRFGHRIQWTYGQVADAPTVTGGYILIDGDGASRLANPSATDCPSATCTTRDAGPAPRSLHVPRRPAPVPGRSPDHRPPLAI